MGIDHCHERNLSQQVGTKIIVAITILGRRAVANAVDECSLQAIILLPTYIQLLVYNDSRELLAHALVHDAGLTVTDIESLFSRSSCNMHAESLGGPGKVTSTREGQSSSPGESHPQALTEPDGNLSAHPALIVQPQDGFRATISRTSSVRVEPLGPANERPVADGSGTA